MVLRLYYNLTLAHLPVIHTIIDIPWTKILCSDWKNKPSSSSSSTCLPSENDDEIDVWHFQTIKYLLSFFSINWFSLFVFAFIYRSHSFYSWVFSVRHVHLLVQCAYNTVFLFLLFQIQIPCKILWLLHCLLEHACNKNIPVRKVTNNQIAWNNQISWKLHDMHK